MMERVPRQRRVERDGAGRGGQPRGDKFRHALRQNLGIGRLPEVRNVGVIRAERAAALQGSKAKQGKAQVPDHSVPSRVISTRVCPLPTAETSSARSSTRSTTYRSPEMR